MIQQENIKIYISSENELEIRIMHLIHKTQGLAFHELKRVPRVLRERIH